VPALLSQEDVDGLSDACWVYDVGEVVLAGKNRLGHVRQLLLEVS
jgi:hypothetical protein